MKEKMLARWERLTRLQKDVVVLLLAAMLGFRVAYCVYAWQEGIFFGDAFLRYEQVGEDVRYTSKVDGEKFTITRKGDGTLYTQWGEVSRGPYTVVEDPSARPKDESIYSCIGIEIREGEEVAFRGGWRGGGGVSLLFLEDGRVHGTSLSNLQGHARSGTYLNALVWVWDGPQLERRGVEILWWAATFLAILTIVETLYADELFRWNLRWTIKDPEGVEPSDWQLTMRGFSAVLIAALALWMYYMGLAGR